MSRPLTNEDAFALGVRAIKAGIEPAVGMKTISLDCGQLRDTGVITEILLNNRLIVSEDLYPLFSVDETVPDFRDPGTRGHAVEQLRERLDNPLLSTRCDIVFVGEDGEKFLDWYVGSGRSGRVTLHDEGQCLTEEEAIAATFEATKEWGSDQGT